MRVLAISDVHVDYRANLEWIRSLSESDFTDDSLILAGDISHRFALVEEAIELLARRFSKVFFTPGNHDLWIREGDDHDSLARFHRLRSLCEDHDVAMEPLLVGDGDPGALWVVPLHSWYEKPEEASTSLFVEKKGEDPSLGMWVDNWAVKWPDFGGDMTSCDYFLGMNEPSVDEVTRARNEGSAAYPVMTYSHFLPRKELMFLTPHERATWKGPLIDPVPEFNFSRVAGTSRLEDQLRRVGATIHVYGHQHRNRDLTFDGVRYLSHCLGYPRERSLGRARGVTSVPLVIWDSNSAQGSPLSPSP